MQGKPLSELARQVWEWFFGGEDEPEFPSFEEYLASTVWGFSLGDGAMLFCRDREHPGIWWVDIYSPGAMPSFSLLRGAMAASGVMGCEIVAINASKEIVRSYCRAFGMDEVEPNVFSIRGGVDGI